MDTIGNEQGIITKVSTKTFAETYASLKSTIDTNPNLKIIAEIDHSSNAEKAGLKLNPTRLIIFGNPNLGTPLMQNTQALALDLPQKMLVWQDEKETVNVSYNDPNYLVKRHGVEDNNEIIQTIIKALNNISNSSL